MHQTGSTHHKGGSGSGGGSNDEWLVVPACDQNSNAAAGTDPCTGITASCAQGEVRYNVYFRQPPGGWQFVRSECRRPAQPQPQRPTAAQLVANFFFHMPLPDPQPSYEPAGGALVNLPAIFDAGAQQLTQSFRLGPLTVTVTAKATRWTWTFDPGVTQSFDKPGGRYPNHDVTHTYATTGTRAVSVTATWTATYSVNGARLQLPVTGTVSRSALMNVTVHEARSQLVAG